MHHLENVYFGFVNLPLHSTLTKCVHSYAVSVAWLCRALSLPDTRVTHSSCGQHSERLKEPQRSVLLNG